MCAGRFDGVVIGDATADCIAELGRGRGREGGVGIGDARALGVEGVAGLWALFIGMGENMAPGDWARPCDAGAGLSRCFLAGGCCPVKPATCGLGEGLGCVGEKILWA